ncbi:MAG: hypothetical protein ACEY3L_10740 [Wolbachia sp.]
MKVAPMMSSQCSFLVIPVASFFCHPNTPSCHPSAQTLGSRKKNGVMKVAPIMSSE